MNMMVGIAAKGAHIPHEGMPPLDISGPPVSFFEFWPQRYFYAPMMLYWLWLTLKHGGRFSLPTAANPAFPMGGWIGESKAAVFDVSGDYARRFIAPWAVFDRTDDATGVEINVTIGEQHRTLHFPKPGATEPVSVTAQ